MNEVARGEGLAGEGAYCIVEFGYLDHANVCHQGTDNLEAALCFYKALKVYPQPSDLITIYDKVDTRVVIGEEVLC